VSRGTPAIQPAENSLQVFCFAHSPSLSIWALRHWLALLYSFPLRCQLLVARDGYGYFGIGLHNEKMRGLDTGRRAASQDNTNPKGEDTGLGQSSSSSDLGQDDGPPLRREEDAVEDAITPGPIRRTASWKDLPRKDQLLVITLARLSEPLVQTSIQSYMFYQLKWFDSTLPDSVISSQAGILQYVVPLLHSVTMPMPVLTPSITAARASRPPSF
jgi:hypothetical protein